jgi:hypothetical protein
MNLLGSLYAAHARGRAAAVALPRTSLSLPRTFACLVYSQFETAALPLAQSNTTAAQKTPRFPHIPGLEGTLFLTFNIHKLLMRKSVPAVSS